MIEHLKNIIAGLWGIGIVCLIVSTGVGIGNIIVAFPFVMVPILVLVVAWVIGKFLRD